MKFPIQLPRVFGWDTLSLVERLKLMGFLAQAGAGIAMTVLAGYAMVKEAQNKAVWPVFYLGETALILVGIVVTGFAGMLIARTLEIQGPGGFVFKSQDGEKTDKAIEGMTAAAQSTQAQAEPTKGAEL